MPLPSTGEMDWEQSKMLFVADRVDLSPNTVRNYLLIIDRLAADTAMPVQQIDKMHLLRFLQGYQCEATYNASLFALKCFFKFASDTYNFPDPSADLRCRKRYTMIERRVISEDEYCRIFFDAAGTTRDMCVFIANTGLRASELTGLRPEHIDTKRRYLSVLGKGAKFRRVPLNHTTLELIPRLQIPRHRVSIHKRCKHLAEAMGIPMFGPHALRHRFATALIDRGIPITTVAKILGHSNVITTASYYFHPENLIECVEILDAPFRKSENDENKFYGRGFLTGGYIAKYLSDDAFSDACCLYQDGRERQERGLPFCQGLDFRSMPSLADVAELIDEQADLDPDFDKDAYSKGWLAGILDQAEKRLNGIIQEGLASGPGGKLK